MSTHTHTPPSRERFCACAGVATPDLNRPIADWSRLIGIVALACLLRGLFLEKSLWLDEGIAVANAWAGGLPLNCWREWVQDLWIHSEFNMAFYFAALRIWLRGGNSEAFVRILSIIPAIATLPVLYAIGRRLFDRRIALTATLLLAVHGAHIAYSQEVRGYTMAVFFCTASTYFLVRAIESATWHFWALYSLCVALGVYSHVFALLLVAAHCISVAWAPKQSGRWLKLVTSLVAVFIASAPALYFAAFNHAHQVEWIPKLRPSQIVNTVSELAGSPFALPVYLILWFMAGIYCWHVWHTEDDARRWHATVIVSWAFVPLVFATLMSIKKPMLVPRYLLISAPAAVLIAAVGAFEIRPRRRQMALWAAVLLSVGFVAYRYTRPKENWRDAAAYVMGHAQPGDAIVVVPAWSEPTFAYYRRRAPRDPLRDMPYSSLSDRALLANAHFKRIWVVIYSRDYALHEPDSRAVLESLTELRTLERQDFRMLQVRLCTPKPANPNSTDFLP